MTVSSEEGIIRFRTHLIRKALQPSLEIAELMAWRDILHRLNLVGQVPTRYAGLGFGNLSIRSRKNPESFVVTGSQTGHLERLESDHFCRITAWNLETAEIWAEGILQPSSESLTHAAVYASLERANAVIHVHCPQLWRLQGTIDLPVSDPKAGCGTVDLALEVSRMLADLGTPESGVWMLGGHEDGILAFGPDIITTGLSLLHWVAIACIREHQQRLTSGTA
ncbi:MAG: class II aldolase/adducin family protein [Thermodesulfobacteriota bacterium]